MFSELVQLNFDKIMQTHSYTVVILAAKDKRFAIYTDPNIGKTLQMFLTGVEKPRPLTHDLFSHILKGFDIRIKQVVINDLQDTVYFARLFLELERETYRHIVEIDARPSDCITLALMNNVPVFCTKEVLEKTIPVED
jgi:bifunctional DNase/RNase